MAINTTNNNSASGANSIHNNINNNNNNNFIGNSNGNTIGQFNKPHHLTNQPMKSLGAKLITWYLLVVWLTWTLVEISIHSVSTDPSIRAWRTLFSSSYTNFGIMGLCLLGSLMALWYSEAVRARNTQLLTYVISTAIVFTWFIDLSFVRHNLTNDDIRGYCQNTVVNGATIASGTTYFSSDSELCELSRAAAVCSVLMEFGFFILSIYSLIRLLLPLSNPTVTLEQQQVTEAALMSNNTDKVKSVNSLNKLIIAFTILSLFGYVITCCSWIKLSTWQYPLTWIGPIGDPVFASMGYQLTCLWCVTWATSILSAGRHSRGIIAMAWFTTTLSSLSLWSFFIFSARRPQQYSTLTDVAFLSAERGVVAGLGIMLCSESIRWSIILSRYYIFIPVTLSSQAVGPDGKPLFSTYWPEAGIKRLNGSINGKSINYPGSNQNNSVDSSGLPTTTKSLPAPFTMPVFSNTSIFLKSIVLFQSLVSFGWFVTQLVLECRLGLFNDIATTYAPERPFPALYMDPERSFLYHLMIIGAAIASCCFSERIPLHCTAVATAALLPCLASAWWLLLWPTLYDMVYDRGVSQSIVLNIGISTGYSKGGKAVSIFGFLTLLSLLLMFFYSLTRAALRATLVTRKVLQLFVSLTVIGTLIWSLSAIKRNISLIGYASPYTPGITNDGYLYMCAFFIMTTVSLSTWINSLISTSYLIDASRGWKELSWFTTWVTFTFILPTFILSCRWVNFDDWNNSVPILALPSLPNNINSSADLSICAGLIILGVGIILEIIDVTLLVSTPRITRKQQKDHKHLSNDIQNTTTTTAKTEKNLEAGMVVPDQMATSNIIKDVNNSGNQNYIQNPNMTSTAISSNDYHDDNQESQRQSAAAEPVSFHTTANNVVV